MKKFLILLIFSLSIFYLFFWRLPVSEKINIQPLNTSSTTILLPLDSRPVCTQMPKQLGKMAGTDVILPPIGFLDNYQQPADREKLYLWLHDNIKSSDYTIISSDLLIHGGLINSRLPYGTLKDQNKFLNVLRQIPLYAPNAQISVFSIIPRLLVSDHLLPDRWYQWHLMRYAKLKDMSETFNDPCLTAELLEIQEEIPPEILNKYNNLYKNNDYFNKNLLSLTYSDIFTVIGQDDGSSFGLPNRNTNHAKMYASHMQNCHITYGADEIAAAIIARNYLKRIKFTPKIYLEYTHPSAEFMYMPFMAASVGETLRDKINLIGAKITEDKQDADIILYINCGSQKFQPSHKETEKLNELLNSHKHVALLDLPANYDLEELLMPHLLAGNVPLNKLTAYAGWNTFSNSAGTVIAQAAIFTGRCRNLSAAELPTLYTQNVHFTIDRILDDYVYQKEFCPQLKNMLSLQKYDSYNLTIQGEQLAQLVTTQYINRRIQELLHYNLGQTPFYTDDSGAYYIKDIRPLVYFPWNRVFEVGLNTELTIGLAKNKNRLN